MTTTPTTGDETKDPVLRVAKSLMKELTAGINQKRTELEKAQNEHQNLPDPLKDDKRDISSHLRDEFVVLDHCHSVICDFT